ncbi:MAG: threonine--tRNA ligase [Defluviitaleaceae bacterium]|nr:threonine--tRNA ligase [Defluviitaleaceae bacterium]
MYEIKLKNGDVKKMEQEVTVLGLAKEISEGLGRAAMGAMVNGEVKDLREALSEDAEVSILTFDDDAGRRAFRHTAAHILAQAVKRLFPDVKFAIGPATAEGFYYDFDKETPFTHDELEAIEAEMKKIIKEDLPLEHFNLPRDEAIKMFKDADEPYKVELIEDLPPDSIISFYKQGEFVDLCAGPHVMSTKAIKALKLTSIAGAYWRGDEKNKMLSRIYGTAFTKPSDLEAHLTKIEEAKKRDHRKLGRELKLFLLSDEGPGFPFFLPAGMVIWNELTQFWREEHKKAGYVEIRSPFMLDKQLWERSGHWENYAENMYTSEIDEREFAIKPMNCPGGMMVYESEPRSYKDLPLRMGELGLVHRHERSGALHGLMRVRCFTQDDAHLYMTKNQVKDEIIRAIELFDKVYSVFGLKYGVELSTRPEKAMGAVEDWDRATDALREALEEAKVPFVINEGDGAFYGPKIDFHIEDSIGRTWQCGTIQLDFQLPEKFELEYVGADGDKHRPVMVHRTLLGSIERFIGVLIEHFAGSFPVWLSPVQAIVLPISDKYLEYAESINEMLDEAGVRAEIDTRAEKIGYKIREARNRRIPYLLVVGEREQEDKTVALRSREGDEGAVDANEFVWRIVREIEEKAL